MGLKSVQRLPCPQRETVRAVIAQSQSHLHLHMMKINNMNLSVPLHYKISSMKRFRPSRTPRIPPKLNDIFEGMTDGLSKATEFKFDAYCILVITLHRIATSAVYLRHHHKIEHDGAKSPSQGMRCLKRTWL